MPDMPKIKGQNVTPIGVIINDKDGVERRVKGWKTQLDGDRHVSVTAHPDGGCVMKFQTFQGAKRIDTITRLSDEASHALAGLLRYVGYDAADVFAATVTVDTFDVVNSDKPPADA